MDTTDINDIRDPSAFKGITFSEFKKTDVKKELLSALTQAKIEPACYWSVELICAGHFTDLWEVILMFYVKRVHLGNPKIASYLDLRVNNFRDIVSSGFTSDLLRLRNNPKVRKMFCEIICVLCEAKRKHSFESVKIKKGEFDLTHMTDRLKAPDMHFVDTVFMPEDPKELFIALNEFAYNISEKGMNTMQACYWIEWILEFEKICAQKNEHLRCERRTFAHVEPKQQMDIIWIVWDIILNESGNKPKIIQNLVRSVLNLFTLRYGGGCAKKRKYYLYFVVELLVAPCNLQEEIVKDKEKVSHIVDKIDLIYKQIKKNEVSPNTDYLFNNVGKSNLDKTIEKLDKMNTLSATFIPRADT